MKKQLKIYLLLSATLIAVTAVEFLLLFLMGGKLIDRPDLKTAMARFHNEARALGLTGKNAPHSLRYAYACDAVQAYQEQGYSRREALALASADLGHGDGRGHYIAHVYTKNGKD